MKKFLSLVLCASLLLTGGCSAATVDNSKAGSEDDKIQIGFSIDSLVVERWERDRDIFVTRANELGAEVNIQNASADVNTQIAQIEYFIDKGVDVIVIVAADSDAFSEVVEEAHKAGIKVIAYDRLLNNSNADLYISFDNPMVGSLMGEALTNVLGDGARVVMINGSPSDNNVQMVDSGFYEVSDAHGWEILDVTFVDGWKQELAFDYINDNFDTVVEADAIMCGNDAIAGQVIKALSEKRYAGKILVTGQDADLDACQRIVEGTQYMTVYKPIDDLAETAAEYAVMLARGETPELANSISDGSYTIPYASLTPYAVTADNIDELIVSSGFHLRDEVYLNIK